MTQRCEDAGNQITLINRIAAHDVDALAALYDRHSRLVFGLILRILRNRSDAEEVLQEVFFAVWNRASTYDVSLGSPVAWLVRIARNRAIDRLRARSSRNRALELPAPRLADSPETDALHREEQRAVSEALGSLPDEQRTLIEHAFLLGLTHSQLAERFQLPLGTVKTRIRTGMMALRQQLHEAPLRS